MKTETAPAPRTAADRVYLVLLDQFMEGTRAAGEQLNIAVLQRELGVSQTPIREALARLEHTGLVRREALKGYRVAPLFGESELVQLFAARRILEPAMAAEAAARVGEEFLAQLLETIKVLDQVSQESSDPSSISRYLSADEHFHRLISLQAGNPFLTAAYVSLGGQVQRFRLFSETGSSDARFAAVEHRLIWEAFRDGLPDLAAERMGEHIANASERALSDRHKVRAKGDGA
jgi:DNA-binding GntR family transcriptional regulator